MSSDAQLIAPVASENHSQRSFRGRVRPWLGLILEIAIVAVWTLLITRPFLNLEAESVPAGIDYGSSIQSHYVWERFLDCQTCAFWNGDLRGGAPSFADVHGDMLHPIVIIPTLAWGTLTGAKIALVLAFFMGGFAQWWLGYALRLGSIPRVWGGMAAVTAGHLAGRIENGNVGLITSMAASALVIPALIQLVWQPTKRHSAVLGVVAAGALLSGQGYYQIGIVLLAPLSLVLLIGRWSAWRAVLRQGLNAALIALLLAAPFLVPFARLWPSFAKNVDWSFSSAQPFSDVPLNLVISNSSFYTNPGLGQLPGPWLYLNYIGWIAVLFGVIGSGFLWPKGQHPLALSLILWATGALWLSSAMPFEWLSSVSDPFPSVVDFLAGLAVPALLALAAAGLECLLEWSRSHSRFWLTSEKDGVLVRHLRLPLSIIVLVIAILSLMDLRSFSKDWIRTVTVDQSTITPVLERLETPSLQWVQTPLGEMWWVPWSIEYGLKIADTWSLWHIEGHDPPRPYLASARGEVPAVAEIIGTPIGDITTYQENDVQHYASVIHQDGARSACSAAGRGGHLEVTCEVEQPGQLVVLENNLGSWNADVNGTDSSVEKNGQWVAVNVPAGDLTIELRYLPWDVWLGLILMIIGVVWATVWLVAPDRHSLPPNISSSLEQRLDVIWQRLRPNSQKDEG